MKSLNLVQALSMAAAIAAFSTIPASGQGLGGSGNADDTESAPKTAPTSNTTPKTTPPQEPEPAQSKAESQSKAEAEPNAEPQAKKIDKSRLPPVATYQAMLDANKKKGWVQFRNYNGNQIVYFTLLQTLHCRLKEIRYSFNNSDLDKRFKLVKCNPHIPFALPTDVKPKDMFVSLAPGTISTISVQVVWEDGRESENVTYSPCPDVGESSCAVLVE